MTKRTVIISCIAVLVIVLSGFAVLWNIAKSRYASTNAIEYLASKTVTKKSPNAGVIPTLLGLEKPRTILLLFLNNTEIRPGGGFLGSYGVITMDRGAVTSLFTDGTENLDRGTPKEFVIEPPQPIKDHLITRWYFRDSNWSPDFSVSAQKSLEFYLGENGHRASEIQTVVGITPNVIAALMKYTGSIEARGKVFTPENITDLLEHTVEIDFHRQGIPREERKAVIGEIAAEMIRRTKHIPLTQWMGILNDFDRLITERHVIMYDRDPEVQKSLDELGWSGRMRAGAPDKLMFVDANLAALKTDRVMKRDVKYEIFKDAASGEWRARVALTFHNNGSFDWRTTRYNTYTRFYFPAGTRFISGEGSQMHFKKPDAAPWDVTNELGHVSIGSFFVTEPGKSKTATVTVALAPSVVAAIQKGEYGLYVQKQLGTNGYQLTIHHDFGTSLKKAVPPESHNKFGDQYFDWTGLITTDAAFQISL